MNTADTRREVIYVAMQWSTGKNLLHNDYKIYRCVLSLIAGKVLENRKFYF